jgi:hypothetical protein
MTKLAEFRVETRVPLVTWRVWSKWLESQLEPQLAQHYRKEP